MLSHVNGWAVHTPPFKVPTLKFSITAKLPLRYALLNLKVSGPGLVSVAVTVNVTGVPKGCGEGTEGVNDVMVTVALREAPPKIASSAGRYNFIETRSFRGLFPKFPIVSRRWIDSERG